MHATESGSGTPLVLLPAFPFDSRVWDRVRIGAGAVIHECVVADDVTIPAGSNYSRCAIAKGDAGLVVETLR